NLGRFSFTLQELAAVALGRASAGTAEAVPALMAGLRADASDGMRMAAARALGEVGPEARPAVPLLREMSKERNPDVREAAQEALQKIGGGPAGDKGQGRAGPGPGALELAEAEREYLWAVEHHGNLLVKYGFGPLAA